MTALGGKPQTTRKANTLHAPHAPQGFKPITPSPERGRGKGPKTRPGATGKVAPNPPALKGTPAPLGRGGGQTNTHNLSLLLS